MLMSSSNVARWSGAALRLRGRPRQRSLHPNPRFAGPHTAPGYSYPLTLQAVASYPDSAAAAPEQDVAPGRFSQLPLRASLDIQLAMFIRYRCLSQNSS